MSAVTRYRVCFMNEVPRIGSGWRIVTALVGHKWVRLAGMRGRGKVTVKEWESIAKTGVELPPRKRKPRKLRA